LKRILLVASLFFVSLVISPAVMADIGIEYEERDTCKILPHTYEVNITNLQESRNIFRVRVPRGFSRWVTVSDSILRISPGDQETIYLDVSAPRGVELGDYNINMTVMTEDEPRVAENFELCFIVLRDYSMEVDDFYIDSDEYSPGETIKATVDVKNDGTKDFDDGIFRIEMMKDGTAIEESSTEFNLETGKRKVIDTSIVLDKLQKPGDYEIRYEVMGAGHTVMKGSERFNIIEVKDYTVEETSDGRYITRTTIIDVKNSGNVVHSEAIERSAGIFMSFLTTPEDAEVYRDGLSEVYRWNVELEPGESTQLRYQVSYWPIYILLVLLAVILFQIQMYIKAPVVKKKVERSEISDDKRVLTVSLYVTNRLFGKAKNVILEDSAPSVTRVLDEFDTLEPSIERKDDETILRWKLSDIEPGDSRVIHYKVKVLVESVDELIFPEASVRGSVDGRTFERSSSKVRIGV